MQAAGLLRKGTVRRSKGEDTEPETQAHSRKAERTSPAGPLPGKAARGEASSAERQLREAAGTEEGLAGNHVDHGRPTFCTKPGPRGGVKIHPGPQAEGARSPSALYYICIHAYMYILPFFLLVLYMYLHIRARELHSDTQADFCSIGEHTHGVHVLAGSRFYTKEQAISSLGKSDCEASAC